MNQSNAKQDQAAIREIKASIEDLTRFRTRHATVESVVQVIDQLVSEKYALIERIEKGLH